MNNGEVLAVRKLWKKLRNRKLNNSGSAMLTVILVVGFLTILATTLLYITGMNFQIKQADYRNKKNFYSGEMGLEQIRANLMEDVSKAGAEAYKNVLVQFVTLGTADIRQMNYYSEFVERLTKYDATLGPQADDGIWIAKLAANGDNWETLLTSYRTDGTLKLDPVLDTNGNGVFESDEVLELHPDTGIVRIKGLQLTYTDPETKITTIITTDLDLYAPPVSWEAERSSDALAGVDKEDAKKRDMVNVSKCVRYTNWVKR
ncbi:MAG: hypothetical protein NC413_02520 [Muribaculum sp.]|nr:hypothetical protein [Muribaculum sp.]